jgi:hypothetical protein
MENEVKVEKMSLVEKIKKFFVKPSELFAKYKEEPKYGKLFLIIGIVYFLVTIIGSQAFKSVKNQQIMESTQNSEAAQMAINLTNSPVLIAITSLFAVLVIYAIIFIISFIYYLVVKLFKGNIKYNQMVSIYSLSYMAVLIGSIVQLAYSLITKKTIGNAAATATDVLIQNLNLFGIWQMVLLVFGISEVAELSKKKSTIVVIILWLLAIAFGLLMLSVGNWFKSIAPTA